MSTLAEFLLARIAEDEHNARLCYDDPACDHAHTWWNKSRVLAECEAKRRIIAPTGSRCSEYVDPDDPDDVAREAEYRQYVGEELWWQLRRDHWPKAFEPFCDGCAAASAADRDRDRVIQILATVYADHRDFDPAWTVTA